MDEPKMTEEQLKQTTNHMHASLKASGVTIDLKDLLNRLQTAGLPATHDFAKIVVDQILFPWLEAQLTKAAQANFMFSLALPLVSALQLTVDAALEKLPAQTAPTDGQASQSPS